MNASNCLARQARAKPCKGMMGLVEEGQEVMAEGEEKGRRRRRPRADRCGAARRALRDCGLHDCEEPRSATAPQRGRSLVVEVAG